MVRPLAVRRHNEIVQRLRAAGSVSVGELANIFGVSHETIRRDLKLLADNGHLDVVHGGAARRGMMEPSIAQRGEENAEGKLAIAREAARMVADGSSVLIDSGTTTAALTHELVGRPGLTVFTNSLNHAVTLCRVRATNQGPRSWAGRSIAFEARAFSATAVARERGRFGLVLEPYGTLETLIGFEGRFDRFEVVAISGGRDHSRRNSRTPSIRKGRKPRG